MPHWFVDDVVSLTRNMLDHHSHQRPIWQSIHPPWSRWRVPLPLLQWKANAPPRCSKLPDQLQPYINKEINPATGRFHSRTTEVKTTSVDTSGYLDSTVLGNELVPVFVGWWRVVLCKCSCLGMENPIPAFVIDFLRRARDDGKLRYLQLSQCNSFVTCLIPSVAEGVPAS